MWKLTFPDGTTLVFEDWDSARIEANLRGHELGVHLVPERHGPIEDEDADPVG